MNVTHKKSSFPSFSKFVLSDLTQILLFFFWLFAFFCIARILFISELFSPCLFAIPGFLVFPLLRRIRKRFVSLGAILFFLFFAIASNWNSFYLIPALFFFGLCGALFHTNFCLSFSRPEYMGRILGFSAGCALLLFHLLASLFQRFFSLQAAALFRILLTAGATLLFITALLAEFLPSGKNSSLFPENSHKTEVFPQAAPTGSTEHSGTALLFPLLFLLICGIGMAVFYGSVLQTAFPTSSTMPANISETPLSILTSAISTSAIPTWTRCIFWSLSLFAAGLLSDLRTRKLLPFLTICTQIPALLLPFFVSQAPAALLAGLAALCISFFFLYISIEFIELACDTSHPALWAGMGPLLCFVCLCFALPADNPLSLFFTASSGNTSIFSLFAYIPVCTFILAILYLRDLTEFGSAQIFVHRRSQKTAGKTPPANESDYQQWFAEKYHFTERETEVFLRMITTEEGIQEMADALFISRRTFQRYITSIYEKTGTKSRMGLYQLYITTRSDNN